MTTILEIVISAVGLSIVTGIMGMFLWYIKVKPDIAEIKSDLAKKAAMVEVERVREDLEHKKQEADRIEKEIDKKRNSNDCDLLRKGCQPLLIQQINSLCVKFDDMRTEHRKLSDKIEKWLQDHVSSN